MQQRMRRAVAELNIGYRRSPIVAEHHSLRPGPRGAHASVLGWHDFGAGHAGDRAPMPGSCCIPDVNPFGSAQGYVEPRTTWCCSQVRSRRGKRTGDCKPWPMQPCTRTRTASNRT